VATGDGALDLKRIRLTRRTREEILADIKARYPNGSPRNLLRHTRFPLGLQSGWAIENDFSLGDRVKIEPDLESTGPSGAPSLKLSLGGNAFDLYSAPFDVAQVLDRHVASLYIKGRGDGTISVLRDSRGIAETKFKINTKEWQRLEIPFEPGLGGKAWALRFHCDGVLWIDALQVEPGEKASAYVSQQPLEVALAPWRGRRLASANPL
jgi:hypothetical protein